MTMQPHQPLPSPDPAIRFEAWATGFAWLKLDLATYVAAVDAGRDPAELEKWHAYIHANAKALGVIHAELSRAGLRAACDRLYASIVAGSIRLH